MARINLLPWRAERRAAKQKRFVTGLLAGVLTTAAIVVLVWTAYSSAISFQEQRNERLRAEIKVLNKKIAEIQELDKLRSQLLARMEVVENLQASRSAPVHFFNEIARTLPEGVSLKSVVMSGASITIDGTAQSNARVSEYMRALDASPWLSGAELVVIKTESKGSVRLASFKLKVKQVPQQSEEEAGQ